MQLLTIQPNEDEATPGDLHAQVSGDNLLLPREFAQAFMREGVRTASDLLSYMESFPSSVAYLLNWKVADVRSAVLLLQKVLSGYLDAGPQTKKYPNPSLGAMDPSLLPNSPYKR